MSPPDTVTVVERRTTAVSPSLWAKLEASSAFWELRRRRLLDVVYDGPGHVNLRGSSWVGRARVDDVVVQFEPKYAGALRVLFGFASASSFRVEDVPATASALGDLASLLVRQLLERARAYLSSAVAFDYIERLEEGSLVGGRIDVARTVALRARGLYRQAAFWRQATTQDVEVNRILLAALRQVEILALHLPLTPDDLMRSRGLARLLDDARVPDVLFEAREGWVARARRFAESDASQAQRDLAALSAVVLAHESFEPEATGGALPRAWFLNLETLFEDAVRVVMSRVRVGCTATRAAGKTPIFSRAVGFSATPDLLLHESGALRLVGDAKYRDWPGSDGTSMHAAVYQLLVHAKAYECDRAFLVYPGEEYAVEDLGTAVTGCRVWAFAFDLSDLQRSANAAATAMLA